MKEQVAVCLLLTFALDSTLGKEQQTTATPWQHAMEIEQCNANLFARGPREVIVGYR